MKKWCPNEPRKPMYWPCSFKIFLAWIFGECLPETYRKLRKSIKSAVIGSSGANRTQKSHMCSIDLFAAMFFHPKFSQQKMKNGEKKKAFNRLSTLNRTSWWWCWSLLLKPIGNNDEKAVFFHFLYVPCFVFSPSTALLQPVAMASHNGVSHDSAVALCGRPMHAYFRPVTP